jgi:dTDP-4-dehydrorhamnose 3,5-epimerase
VLGGIVGIKVEDLSIPDVKLIHPPKFGDHRGFFSEVYNQQSFSKAGISLEFVQDNHSLSGDRGTVRGLHFQSPPNDIAKLVRVTRGSVFDVAVDIRHGSPTFGQHVAAVLSAENWLQILVPAGFAHAFCTLEPDTEVVYKVTGYWASDWDYGVRWNDPALGIDWPVNEDTVVLSDKDREQPFLKDLPAYFTY